MRISDWSSDVCSSERLKAAIETSEESLLLAFRRAREKQLGRRHRALPPHIWQVLEFAAATEFRTWGHLRRAWNREHGEMVRYSSDRTFAQAGARDNVG